MCKRVIIAAIVLLSLDAPSEALALDNSDQKHYSQNVFGNVGLIQTPSARFSDDGEFSFGLSNEDPYKRIYSKMQFFPWMEAVLRYSEGTYKPYNPGSNQTWKDKGLDLKIKLLDERKYLPALAIGLSDLGGTGAFGSEYVVASKALNNFDISLGMGWGRLNGTNDIYNPFRLLSGSFREREKNNQLGGKFNIGRFFSSEKISLFGGIEYFTPLPNLSFKLEYDTSNYTEIIRKPMVFNKPSEIISQDSKLNYALHYNRKINDRENVDFSLGLVRGNIFYANVSISSNLNLLGKKKFVAPSEKLNNPYLEPFPSLDKEWKKYLSDLIMWQMGNVGFVTHNLIFNGSEMQVEISQGRFQDTIQAIDLASRILANNSPKNIKTITVINIDHGMETLRSSIARDKLVNEVSIGPLSEESLQFNNFKPRDKDRIIMPNEILYPNFYWDLKPHLLGTIQHQEKFYFWQLEALLHTEYSITRGLYLTTDIGFNIKDNYEKYTYHIPDGELFHVRQDRRKYLTEGKSGLRRMALDYNINFSSQLKGKVSVGYLEWMFGGIGGEILYKPEFSNWAIGMDAYLVKMRDFDQKFSFRDYKTFTGFLSYYYDIPFYNMRLKVNAGKFLGQDKGALIDVSRRFKTGARVGGIVALTDCDAKCVGEGSFNKWIYFNLPMDLFYTKRSTRGKAGYAWSPLTKDAGAKLGVSSLYDVVSDNRDEVSTLRRNPWSVKKIFSGFSTSPKSRI
jgi:hypothetical protein